MISHQQMDNSQPDISQPIKEIILDNTAPINDSEAVDSLQTDTDHLPEDPYLSKQNVSLPHLTQSVSLPISSSNIKVQELPEFRIKNATINTTNQEEQDQYHAFVALNDSKKVHTKSKVEEAKLKAMKDPFAEEHAQAAKSISNLMGLRDKYMFEHCQYSLINDLVEKRKFTGEPLLNYYKEDRIQPPLENKKAVYRMEEGVFMPYVNDKAICEPISMDQYLQDLILMIKETHNSINKSFCFKRLNILEEKFRFHLLYNQEKEVLEQKCNQERDFYNVRKVDTHIHHSACMNVNLLLEFIKKKLKEEPNRPVVRDPKTGNEETLVDVFNKYCLNPNNINVSILDMQVIQILGYIDNGCKAGLDTFQRFDRFNKKYNPFSLTEFREIFLKTDNFINGEYLADITHEVFKNYSQSKYLFSELRISIYGKNEKEWEKLADWFENYKIYHHQTRWMIQIPRLYEVYRRAGIVKNFQKMLENIFRTLFEVTIDPSKNPKLAKLLLQIVGFDSVDDESVYETSAHANSFKISPEQWNYAESPHYCYWSYYLWANVYTLNHLRKLRGLNTFAFRPHCGEAGSPEHLMGAFLLADGINHGIRLQRAPVLEYLYYLKQIGIAMSPLSNNKLFAKYTDNPLPKFFARGLNVSLSTDDPLIFHMTKEPLMEEYSIAMQIYNLSVADICEIARNSVLQSGFEDIVKKYWLGENYKSKDGDDNCFEKANVPHTRHQYRRETYLSELKELKEIADSHA